MEFEHVHKIALIGFLGAVVFGALANRSHFCTMGAISDWVNMGSLTRLRVWVLALGVTLIGTQCMQLFGWIDLGESIYLSTNFTWLGYVIGGLLFGIGMTIGSGCGQKTLVRLGAGNLKSLIVFLVLGITAYMTLRGLLSLVRLQINDPTALDLSGLELTGQGVPAVVHGLTGISRTALQIGLTVLVGGGALLFALRDRQIRNSADNLLAGIGIGALVVGAWYTTGVLGYDDFDPLPLEGVSFISPVGNTISYLMTYTGATVNFGIAIVLGTVCGSFLYSIATGTFRIESFSDRSDLVSHLAGGALMGFGGVLALGCTIGQGLTGMSTLAAGSVISLASIVLGCVFTLKLQYHLLDGDGFRPALGRTLRELVRLGPAG